MDAPSNYGHPAAGPPPSRGSKKLGKRTRAPQLFNDISQQQQQPQMPPPHGHQPPSNYNYGGMPPPPQQPGGYLPQQSAPQFPGQQYLNDPVASMAMQYGGNIADQGKEYMQKNLEKYVSTSKIKYYFAVDTAYVGKKLSLLLFPFTHNDWSVSYNQDEPVAPRYDVNAPDLYIPVMGFVTFVLVSAVALGLDGRFTPETIGVGTSSALGYMILEILIILFSLYILNVQTSLTYLDWTAYCGYKYFGMVISLCAGVFINKLAYYVALGYTGLVLAYFITRSLKVQILPHAEDHQQSGNKRRMYVLLSLAAIQPVFMWWLTFTLV